MSSFFSFFFRGTPASATFARMSMHPSVLQDCVRRSTARVMAQLAERYAGRPEECPVAIDYGKLNEELDTHAELYSAKRLPPDWCVRRV